MSPTDPFHTAKDSSHISSARLSSPIPKLDGSLPSLTYVISTTSDSYVFSSTSALSLMFTTLLHPVHPSTQILKWDMSPSSMESLSFLCQFSVVVEQSLNRSISPGTPIPDLGPCWWRWRAVSHDSHDWARPLLLSYWKVGAVLTFIAPASGMRFPCEGLIVWPVHRLDLLYLLA